ncbi:MAG TPA: hypothetical protein VM841_05275 [Actinomycetota bacterium]|nr:hypothetical protein [Actinomycetota bacterium]
MSLTTVYLRALATFVSRRDERGAVGALILGIVIGIGLVVFGIIKLLIPGD